MSIQDKLTAIAENVPKVYEAGIAEGKVQENLDFWNMMTLNGTRGFYTYAFRYWGWKVANPPVLIKPTGQYHTMINESPNLETIVPDNFDFSATPDIQTESTNAYYHTFSNNPKLKAIPDMNMPPRGMYYTFYNCPKLERIERVQVRENTVLNRPFQALPSLKYLRIEGTIGDNMFLADSKYLDKDSILNIFECLSTTVTGKTVTLNKLSVMVAFETSEGAKDGIDSAEWNALTSTRPYWTIAFSTNGM